MSFLNPDFTDLDEVVKAQKAGRVVALVFVAMNVLGALVVYFADTSLPGMGTIEDKTGALIGIAAEALFALFVAWRFHVGKGAFAGSALLLLVLLEILLKIVGGSIGGIVILGFLTVGLFHAVRAAFELRSAPSPVVADTFE